MQKTLSCCAFIMLLAVSAFAVEIPLTDGTRIEAESYRVVDGFVMIKLVGGGQIAYATTDVDMQALRQAEAAAAAESESEPEESTRRSGDSIVNAVALQQEGSEVVSITDQDVAHVRPPIPGAEGEEGEEGEEGVEGEEPAQTGAVNLRAVRMEHEDGAWVMKGEVYNGTQVAVQDVQVEITSTVGGAVIDQRRLSVAPALEPGQARSFAHRVRADERPQTVVKTFWMQPAPAE